MLARKKTGVDIVASHAMAWHKAFGDDLIGTHLSAGKQLILFLIAEQHQGHDMEWQLYPCTRVCISTA